MELKDYTDGELLKSIEAEVAKSLGELRCLQGDADKINSRLRFALAVLHTIKERKDQKE